MICPKCGTENSEGTKFCVKCGMPFINTTSSTENTNQSSLGSNTNNTMNNQMNSNISSQMFGTSSQPLNTINQPSNTGINNMNSSNNENVNSTMNPQNTAQNIPNPNISQTVGTSSFNTPSNEQPQTNIAMDNNPMSQGVTMNQPNGQVPNNQPKVHNSIIRKSIKKNAKSQKRGILMGWQAIIIAFIVGLFVFTIMDIMVQSQSLSDVPSLITIIVGFTAIATVSFAKMMIILAIAMIFIQIIYFGMTQVALKISRGEPVKFFDVITSPFKKFKSFLKFLAVFILWSIIIFVLGLIPYVGALAVLILFIFTCPSLVIIAYKLADENYQNLTLMEIIKTSFAQTKGHKVEFYTLIISSIGWIILALITCGILGIWVNPYITMIMTNYYRYVIGEAEFYDAKPGLSNAAIIVIGIIVYTLAVVLMGIGLTSLISNQYNQIDSNYDYDSDYDYDDYDYDSTYIKEMSGVKVYIPSSFTHSSSESYDDIYTNSTGTAFIGVSSINFVNINSLDDYLPDFIDSMEEAGFTCQNSNYQNINGNRWDKLYCTSSTQADYVYFTLKDSTIYMVDFAMTNDVSSLYSSYIADIEDNLDLVD